MSVAVNICSSFLYVSHLAFPAFCKGRDPEDLATAAIIINYADLVSSPTTIPKTFVLHHQYSSVLNAVVFNNVTGNTERRSRASRSALPRFGADIPQPTNVGITDIPPSCTEVKFRTLAFRRTRSTYTPQHHLPLGTRHHGCKRTQ